MTTDGPPYGPDFVIDLTRMESSKAQDIVEQVLDQAPTKVNLFAAAALTRPNDPAELTAVGAQWISALANELAETRRAVQKLADDLDATMALHHRSSERDCDKWRNDICQVADDLREI